MALPTLFAQGAYNSGTTSVGLVAPANIVAGMAMYIILESSDGANAAGTPATPNGWTKLAENTCAAIASVGISTQTIFGKIAGDGESGATTTVDGVLDHCSGAITVVTGHWMRAITDTIVGAFTDHGATQVGCSTLAITVPVNTFIILAINLTDDAADTTNHSNWVNANLASITERIDQTVTTGAGGGIGITTATKATAGSTGATTWDHDTAVQSGSLHLGVFGSDDSGTLPLLEMAPYVPAARDLRW